jgi:hypothetical protein
MRVCENFEVPNQIIEMLKRREFRPRHYSVSKLICCPRKTFYAMTGVKEIVPDEQTLVFTRGRAHHGILEVYKLKEVERKKDSEILNEHGQPIPIYGDIDMIGDRITEIFTTTISSAKVKIPSDATEVFPMKIKQLRAYCHFEKELTGDLLVFFLFGDYQRFIEVAGQKQYVGLRPKLRCFTYDFEEGDLLEVWQLMNNNIAEIEQAKKTGIPPFLTGEKWECDNCGYSYICLGDEPVAPKDISEVVAKAMESDIR